MFLTTPTSNTSTPIVSSKEIKVFQTPPSLNNTPTNHQQHLPLQQIQLQQQGNSDSVQATIWHLLNNYAYEDAIFLAERLLANDDPSSDEQLKIYLLATSYYRSGEKLQCFEVLQGYSKTTTLSYKCRLLLAQVSWELERATTAEQTLLQQGQNNSSSSFSVLDCIQSSFYEVAPFALLLYGKICVSTERQALARDAYGRALKLNPFLFSAFEGYCKLDKEKDKISVSVEKKGDRNKENFGSSTGDPSTWVSSVFQTSHMQLAEILQYCHGYPNSTTAGGAGGGGGIMKDEPMEIGVSVGGNGGKGGSTLGVLMNRNTSNNNPHHQTSRRTFLTSTPNTGPGTMMPLLPPPIISSLVPGSTGILGDQQTPPMPPTSSIVGENPPLLVSPIVTKTSTTLGGGDNGGNNAATIPLSSAEPRPKKPCLRTSSVSVSSSSASGTQSQSSVRRSSRLFTTHSQKGQNEKVNKMKENKGSHGSHGGGHGGNNNNQGGLGQISQTQVFTSHHNTNTSNSHHNPRTLLDNLLQSSYQRIAVATMYLSRYECRKAIEVIQALPPREQGTSSPLKILARAYFEIGDYERAISTYKDLQTGLIPHPFDPALMYLSSCYWHLGMETSLSSLSLSFLQDPINKASNPSTWIILGNTFSHQREHERAIKFFKRGIQIATNLRDSSSTTNSTLYYAYILLAHEFVATEELDKALRAFRTAARVDPSQYNSWYGIGMIYYKQERYQEAEYYYEKALTVNSGGNSSKQGTASSGVLLCHLGVVQNALGKPDKSLSTFDRALKLNSKDPLCKFHRASVLFGMGKLDEALLELEELKKLVPKESLVHFLIAKIHSKRGETHKALLHFSWATDLDPKGANSHIKESIEPLLNSSSSNVPMPGANISAGDEDEDIQDVNNSSI